MLHSRTIPLRSTGYIGWSPISRYSLPPPPKYSVTSKLKFINNILQISQFEKVMFLKKSLIPYDIHVYSLNALKEKLILRLILSCL